MIVHYRLLTLRVHHNALSTRRIDIAMARKNGGAATLGKAVFSIGIEVRSGDGLGAADSNAILVALWHEFMFRTTALADGEENVIEFLVLVHDCTFLDCKVRSRITDDVLDIGPISSPRLELLVIAHFDLLNARPVAAKGEVYWRVCILFLEYVRVDEIVSRVLWKSDGAVVYPFTGVKRLGRRDADLGVLGANE